MRWLLLLLPLFAHADPYTVTWGYDDPTNVWPGDEVYVASKVNSGIWYRSWAGPATAGVATFNRETRIGDLICFRARSIRPSNPLESRRSDWSAQPWPCKIVGAPGLVLSPPPPIIEIELNF